LYVLFLSSDAHPRGPRSLPTRRSSDLPVNRPTCTSRLQSERPSRRGVWWCQQKGGANRLAIGRVNARSNPRTKGGNNVRQRAARSEEHTSELQSREKLVCRLLHEKKKR